jgi:hypothetical protein
MWQCEVLGVTLCLEDVYDFCRKFVNINGHVHVNGVIFREWWWSRGRGARFKLREIGLIVDWRAV